MKLTFEPPNDGQLHAYCLSCGHDGQDEIRQQDRQLFRCRGCGHIHPRALVIDPQVLWSRTPSGEYKHSVAGVFLANLEGNFLFFRRTKFPFAITVPAGHVAPGESTVDTAIRELREETGVSIQSLKRVDIVDIPGDQCRRGADTHTWDIYVAQSPDQLVIELGDEGADYAWLTLDQALDRPLTYAVRYVITRYAAKLHRMVQ